VVNTVNTEESRSKIKTGQHPLDLALKISISLLGGNAKSGERTQNPLAAKVRRSVGQGGKKG